MNHFKNIKLDVHEEFDCSYLTLQILNYKKWIIISTVLFFSLGSFYCLTAPKIWSANVRIQEPNQDDQQELYALNRELTKLIYGFDKFAAENILNEFVQSIHDRNTSLKIRKDLNKSYLAELSSTTPIGVDRDLIELLNSENEKFVRDYLSATIQYIRSHIKDESNLIKDQMLIQTNLKAFLVENYIFRLNYFKTFSGQLYNPDKSREYINDSIDMLLIYGDQYLSNKYAFIYSNEYQKQEVESFKLTLAKVKVMLDQPMHPKAFHVAQNVLFATEPKSPNVPVILILSAVFGFMMGLFGILLYLSSSPLIRQK